MRAVRALVPSQTPKTRTARGSWQHAATLPRAWHLLSLDAPTVAAIWCVAFLRAVGVSGRSPTAYWSALFLSLATWLCYVGDRVLDARSAPANQLRARHRFYGTLWRSQRAPLLVLLSIAAVACSVIALTALSASVLASYAALSAISLIYFAWVHRGAPRSSPFLGKECAVAVIFACGCLIPAWHAGSARALLGLAPRGALFALLCWLNCVAIERWEAPGDLDPAAHRTTRWAARHLTLLLCVGASLALALRLLFHPLGALRMLGPCLASAFALLAVFDRLRARLSAGALRILADAALLTPLAWWLLSGITR
jgi:hypothetical protein